MCGIIGYLGISNGFTMSMNGLEQRKNRGYDSSDYCGIEIEKVNYLIV